MMQCNHRNTGGYSCFLVFQEDSSTQQKGSRVIHPGYCYTSEHNTPWTSTHPIHQHT